MEQSPLDENRWSELTSLLGDDLINFMLNCDAPPRPAEFTVEQGQAAALMLSLWPEQDYPMHAHAPWALTRIIERAFCSYFPAYGGTLATALHYSCGGERPQVPTENNLEQDLCALAADAFPTLLIAGRPAGDFVSLSHLYTHPRRAAAERNLFQSDEPLMRLFPHADFSEPIGANCGSTPRLTSYLQWNDGSAGTISSDGMIECILKASIGASPDGRVDLEAYVTSVRHSLQAARKLANGEAALVPAIVGLYGVNFASSLTSIPLHGAIFRRKTQLDHNIGWIPGPEEVILEIPTELQLVCPPQPFDGSMESQSLFAEDWPTQVALAEEFRERLVTSTNRARMAVLLASGSDEVLAMGASFTSVMKPLGSSTQSRSSRNQWPQTPFRSRPVDQTDVQAIQRWDEALQHAPEWLSVGQERILLATSERESPKDGFIDAVIAWESLFGGSGETTLRVCLALAYLFHAAEPEARYATYEKLRTMYGQRSSLVHGGDKPPNHTKAIELRDDAVQVALRAWRAVLCSKTLLACKKSPDRGLQVILGSVQDLPPRMD
ncbi:HEPN domain-containing protein [Paenarthrobacter ilicis]|uniref:hypothetical protein n=1 Tax=Paenarthrobacter ilicis TaxID=43665 RepID=UPI003008A8EA